MCSSLSILSARLRNIKIASLLAHSLAPFLYAFAPFVQIDLINMLDPTL
jgi:hypothetical protein